MILRASRAFRYVEGMNGQKTTVHIKTMYQHNRKEHNDLQIQLLGYKNQIFYHKGHFLFMAVSHLFFRLVQRMYCCNIVCLNILVIKLNY